MQHAPAKAPQLTIAGMGVTTSDDATSDHAPYPNRSATNSKAAQNPIQCKTPCIPSTVEPHNRSSGSRLKEIRAGVQFLYCLSPPDMYTTVHISATPRQCPLFGNSLVEHLGPPHAPLSCASCIGTVARRTAGARLFAKVSHVHCSKAIRPRQRPDEPARDSTPRISPQRARRTSAAGVCRAALRGGESQR